MKKIIILCFLFIYSTGQAWDAKSFKKPKLEELKKNLTPTEFQVTQKDGTEPAYKCLLG
jgi:hypothetical protein